MSQPAQCEKKSGESDKSDKVFCDSTAVIAIYIDNLFFEYTYTFSTNGKPYFTQGNL
jgi:hypothetical protein